MKPSNRIYDGEFTPEKMHYTTICHQAIFYKRRIFRKYGYFNTKYKVLADHDLNIKWFFSKTTKSVFVDRIVAIYFENGFSSIYKDFAFYNELSKKLFWRGIGTYSIVKLKELAKEVSI